MKKYIGLFAASLACLCIPAVCAAGPQSAVYIHGSLSPNTDWQAMTRRAVQRCSAASKVKVGHLHADNVPASAVFLALADRIGLPVGIELMIDGEKEKTVTIDVHNKTPYEIFDQLFFAGGQTYTEDHGGAGYLNYVPNTNRTPQVVDLSSKAPRKEPRHTYSRHNYRREVS